MTRSWRCALVVLLASPCVVALAPVASAAPPSRTERCVALAERGQQERDRAAFTEARVSLRACAADECPSLVRKDCAQWLAEVEASTPTVVLGAKSAEGNDVIGARIFVDGKPYQEQADTGRAVPLDPGAHVFRFEHPPDAPVELTEVVRMGEHNRPIYGTFAASAQAAAAPVPVAAPVPGASSSSSSSPSPLTAPQAAPTTHVSGWAYALGAVAVVGGASFAYFGATGLHEKSQLRSQCGNTCSDAQVEPLEVKYITADASLGVGVIAGAIATWLFLHPSVHETTEPAATLSLTPTRGGGAFALRATF